MIFKDGAYTKRTAQEVASGLHHLIKHPEVGTYKLDVRIERRRSGAGQADRKESTYWVKPLHEEIITLANGAEIVRLVTDEGQRLDVIFGKSEERDFEPALVLLPVE